MALLLMFILSSFSLVQYEPVKIINGIHVKDEPSEDFDDGYADGYCEAYRDYIGNQYADCAVPPYIDNSTYLAGCENYYKCGFKAGLKHGKKDYPVRD